MLEIILRRLCGLTRRAACVVVELMSSHCTTEGSLILANPPKPVASRKKINDLLDVSLNETSG